MSATTSSAVKASIEGLSLGLPVFVRKAPINKADGTPQALPFLVVSDPLGNTPERTGDGGIKRSRELLQIDIYQVFSAPSPTLAKDVYRALSGIKLTTSPQHVYRVELGSMVPLNDEPNDIKRDSITVTLRRRL